MKAEKETLKEVAEHSVPTRGTRHYVSRPAPRCRFHSKYNMPCSSPLMREIEGVSKYVLDVRGVRPDYIENLKRFKATVDENTLCYTAYMQMLDRLVEYAQKLEQLNSRQHGEK